MSSVPTRRAGMCREGLWAEVACAKEQRRAPFKKQSPFYMSHPGQKANTSSRTPRTPNARAHMSLPSIDMLKGALAAHDQSTDGTQEELHRRLGDVLVAKLLCGNQLPSATSTSSGKRPAVQEPVQSSKPKAKRRKSQWHIFVQTESKKVREGRPDLKGHEVLKECARRWKIVCANKASNSSPPMLANGDDGSDASSESAADGLANALMLLPPAEVEHGLHQAGLAVEPGNTAGNASRLANSMLD